MSFHLTKPPRRRRFSRPPGLFTTSTAYFLSGCGVVLVIGGILMWMNHLFPERRNESLQTCLSPDGSHQAVMFRRTIQGNDTRTTHVAILRAKEKLTHRAHQSNKAYIAEGVLPLQIQWIDDNHLVIDDPEGAKVILRAAQVGKIRISENLEHAK